MRLQSEERRKALHKVTNWHSAISAAREDAKANDLSLTFSQTEQTNHLINHERISISSGAFPLKNMLYRFKLASIRFQTIYIGEIDWYMNDRMPYDVHRWQQIIKERECQTRMSFARFNDLRFIWSLDVNWWRFPRLSIFFYEAVTFYFNTQTSASDERTSIQQSSIEPRTSRQ